MEMYARIINKESGLVEVGDGDINAVWETDIVDMPDGSTQKVVRTVKDFYEFIGMELMEVEQAYNGAWYIAGKAPAPPKTKEVRTFSKFSIWVATRELPISSGSSITVWQAFESFLHDNNLWSGWNQLIDLVEDNEFFLIFYPKAVDAFGKELVDQVLAASTVSVKTVIVSEGE